MNYRTNQNTDKERKDIFSILQSSLGFPKEGDILLSEVHKRVLNTISDIILLRKEDMSVVICASKLKLISSSERNESVRLSLGSNNSAAVLTVYRQQYTIRVDSKKGITLILGDRDLSETIIVNNLAPFVYDVECYIRYRNIELEEASVASLKNDLRIINDSLSSSFTNKELILSIPDLTDDRGWMDLVYAPFFAYSFECICRSVLSGEYAMDDGFSQKVRILAQKLRNSTLYEGPLNDEDSYLSSWLIYFASKLMPKWTKSLLLYCVKRRSIMIVMTM